MSVLSLRQNALSTFSDREKSNVLLPFWYFILLFTIYLVDCKNLCQALQKVEIKSQWTNVVKLILCGDGNVGYVFLLLLLFLF